MSNIYLLFICIVVPIFMMTFFIDKKSRIFVVYMCIGCTVCLLAGEVNTMVKGLLPNHDLFYITINITPIVEEILKAIPVLLFALIISDNQEILINISMVTGIGFAILENTYLLLNADNPNLIWALIRGLGAGFMHGLSTLFVGFGLSYIRKKKAFLYPGILGLLSSAILFHSIYNAFVQSAYAYLGYFYPMVVFIIIKLNKHLFIRIPNRKTKAKAKTDGQIENNGQTTDDI